MTGFSRRAVEKLSKLSAEQIQQLLNRLCDEEAALDAVLESLATGIIVCSVNGHLLMLNKAAERYIPFTTRPLENRDTELRVWEMIDDSDIVTFLKINYEHQKSNVSDEFSVPGPGGGIRFLSVKLMPLVQRCCIKGTIITVDDITEKRNQEILLRRMENLAGLTNLAANVAHEIKNPLGSISIHIQLMQKALAKARCSDGMLPDEKNAEKHLSVINEEIDRLNKIIMDFLFAVRPVSAQLELLDPNQLIQDCIDFCRPELQGLNIKQEISLDNSVPRLMLDSKLFRQVLVNLIQNAQAAMPDGGVLCIKTVVQNDCFVLTLTDTGVGMDEATVSHVFEPYFTTKATGTGLGLTMVYKIIKEFSGDITVRSAVGKGSVFTISLPIPQGSRRLLTYTDEK